jgi:hypothetical protein
MKIEHEGNADSQLVLLERRKTSSVRKKTGVCSWKLMATRRFVDAKLSQT